MGFINFLAKSREGISSFNPDYLFLFASFSPAEHNKETPSPSLVSESFAASASCDMPQSVLVYDNKGAADYPLFVSLSICFRY
jgi:hypothetical protein